MPKKKMRRSAPSSFERTDFCHRSSKVVLSDLPDELLRNICEFLDPQSLIAISNLNIDRLNNQFVDFRYADFSTCNSIGPQELKSYFNRERAKHLKELNFNNVFSVSPSILTTCIEKCKNITKLYIWNCGITLSKLLRIFECCTHLEELYWSIKFEKLRPKKTPEDKRITTNIKKLYLQTDEVGLVLLKLLDMCPNTEELVFNFSDSYVTSLPANSASRYISMQLRMKTQACSLSFLLQFNNILREKSLPRELLRFIHCMCMRNKMEEDAIFELGGGDLPFHLTYHTSLLQIFFENENPAELPTLPDESVKSLVMIMNNNSEILNHLDKIKKMTGNALKHLSLHKWLTIEQLEQHSSDDIVSLHMSDILCGLVANSCNITVLDLTELHMRSAFPFASICSLRRLKVFNVSTCCFILNNTSGETQCTVQEDFQNFVKKCNKVERLSISDCIAGCKSPPMSDMLTPISKWEELRYLSVRNVKALRECQFLIPIADSCSKLKSLEFTAVGEPKVCLFMSSLKHVLMKSKELTFLRINQPGFYPMDPLLWNHIGSAQKLQGLCLLTHLSTAIENKTVLYAINELPHLHLFHLAARKSCVNLRQQINQLMTRKGVQISNMKITLHPISHPVYECVNKHFATN